MDQNGDFSVGAGIIAECFLIGLCEPWLLVYEVNFFKGKWNFFLEKGKPGSLSKGANAVCDKGDFSHQGLRIIKNLIEY